MDVSQIFLSLVGVCCIVLGWFARELYTATQSLRRELSLLEIRIGTDYVRYDRLQDALRPVMETLHEIKDTLNKKVDK